MESDIAKSILALAIGLVSSSGFVGMNLTLGYIAFPSFYLPGMQNMQKSGLASKSTRPESSPMLLLRQWALAYQSGHAFGPTSLILSTLCFIYAARTGPDHWRNLLYVGAASAGAGFPFTVVTILPVNTELYARVDRLMATSDKAEQAKIAGGDTPELIAKCLWYSKIRACLPVPALAIGLAAVYSLACFIPTVLSRATAEPL